MVEGVLARHPTITLKKARNLSIACAMDANPTVISQWFDLLKKIQTEVGIVSPTKIWLGNETDI